MNRVTGLAIAWLLLSAAALAHAGQDCEINGKDAGSGDARSIADKSGILRCKDHDTGQPVSEATLDNGHELGLVRSFHPDGSLRRVSYRDETGADRAVAEFTPRKQLSLLRCGEQPMLAPAVDDAKLCGFGKAPSRVELFDDNGTLRSRVTYLNGKRLRLESLYDNGKVARQEEQVGNRRIERRFSSEGIKRREVTSSVLERGGVVMLREQEFSEKGTLVRDQQWDAAGEPQRDESFFSNGKPRSQVVYSGLGEARVADVTEFHDNGERASQGRFLAPARAPLLPTGVHRRFNEKGGLIAESTYDGKGRVTRERVWNDGGELLRDEGVSPDGSHRAFAQ